MVADKKRTYTVAEFSALISRPENAGRLLELIDGEIIEKRPTEEHGILAGNIVTEFNLYLRQNRIGRAGVEIRYRLPDDDQNERLPDVSFRKAPGPAVREGPVDRMPDLAVEIKSPDQTYKLMRDKADYYLANGSQVVWLIYPEKRLVEVLTAVDREILSDTDSLNGGEVLPGFVMKVSNVFSGLE